MASEVIIIGAGLGAVALVVGQSQPAPRPTQLTASGGVTVGVSPGSSVSGGRRIALSIGRYRAPSPLSSTHTAEPTVAAPTSGNTAGTSDPVLKGKLDAIEVAAKKQYESLSSDAKAQGAAKLNETLNPSPPLTGNEDWDKVGSVVGGALGGAAGSYIGGPIGAKLGALVGAYLGTQLADLLSKNWDELQAWLSSKWDSAVDAASDAYDYASDAVNAVGDTASDAYDAASGAYDDVASLF